MYITPLEWIDPSRIAKLPLFETWYHYIDPLREYIPSLDSQIPCIYPPNEHSTPIWTPLE